MCRDRSQESNGGICTASVEWDANCGALGVTAHRWRPPNALDAARVIMPMLY